MLDYEINFDDLKEQIAKLKQWDQVSSDLLKAAMRSAVGMVQRGAKQNAPVGVSGELRSKISTSVKQIAPQNIEGIVRAGAPYSLPVEVGQRPHFPPLRPIALWVERKLGVSGWDGIRVTITIARKIAARGVRPKPFMLKAFVDKRAAINARFQEAINRIMERMAVK